MSNNNFLLNYACFSSETKGRSFKEQENENRSCFQRDRDRIIHSNAFRKLEYKTQVFINYAHDYYRTRLTHSLEVAQIARSITRRLGLNEDITECIALAHDLGHPPFGHAGEDALRKSIQDLNFHNRSLSKPIYDEKYLGEVQTSTAEYSNVFEEQRQASITKLPSEIELRNRSNEKYEFDHNVQAIRILTYLEQKHADFDGMNLSWEVVEGIAKHNGPLLGKYAKSPTNNELMIEYNEKYDLKLEEFSSAEAQVASIADDIAYSVHDLDDALRADLIAIDDLLDVPLIGKVFKDIKNRYSQLPQSKLIHESLSRTIGIMINDVVSQTEKNIKDFNVQSVKDVRKLDRMLVTLSPEVANDTKEMKKFNMEKIYRSYKLNRTMNKAKRIVQELFQCFYENPNLLPTEWSRLAYESQRSIVICDYISGMTDRFAIHEHRRIFDTSYEMTSF